MAGSQTQTRQLDDLPAFTCTFTAVLATPFDSPHLQREFTAGAQEPRHVGHGGLALGIAFQAFCQDPGRCLHPLFLIWVGKIWAVGTHNDGILYLYSSIAGSLTTTAGVVW